MLAYLFLTFCSVVVSMILIKEISKQECTVVGCGTGCSISMILYAWMGISYYIQGQNDDIGTAGVVFALITLVGGILSLFRLSASILTYIINSGRHGHTYERDSWREYTQPEKQIMNSLERLSGTRGDYDDSNEYRATKAAIELSRQTTGKSSRDYSDYSSDEAMARALADTAGKVSGYKEDRDLRGTTNRSIKAVDSMLRKQTGGKVTESDFKDVNDPNTKLAKMLDKLEKNPPSKGGNDKSSKGGKKK